MALILVMGIPAAGKSTFRREIQNSAPHLVATTSFDDFRCENSLETARRTRKSFESHVEHALSATDRPIWLIEDIFYLQSMRRPFERIARRRAFQFGIVYLKVPFEEAIRRNSLRKVGKMREETIRKVSERMEPPAVAVVVPESGIGLAELLRRLKIRMPHKVPEVRRAKDLETVQELPSTPSVLESLDVLTRRIVSDIMQNSSLDGRKLSTARRMLLKNTGPSSSFLPDSVDVLKHALLDIYNKL
ncbi:unnamed protein product [Caenorhabditis sp. 36 PRJEB53466]|nr:unnamed protein product [Caenorhabditis sp. 36 PRJEB53466]